MNEHLREKYAELWLQHMRRGDFESAWRVSDLLLDPRPNSSRAHLPLHLQSVWSGAPLSGKRVLLRCHHGLGDTLQFIHYAPLVKAIATEVIVWTQPSLIPLLQTACGADRFIPLPKHVPKTDCDVDVELMELPHVFRTSCEDSQRSEHRPSHNLAGSNNPSIITRGDHGATPPPPLSPRLPHDLQPSPR